MPEQPGALENFLSINPAFASYYANRRGLADQQALQGVAAGGEFDPTKFNDPVAGAQGAAILQNFQLGQQQRASQPILSNFQNQYEDITGTGTETGQFSDPESIAEMQKAGMTAYPTQDQQQNPYVAKALQDFRSRGRQVDLMRSAIENPTAGNLAQFAVTNPEHFASNMKQAQGLLSQKAVKGDPEINALLGSTFAAPNLEVATKGLQDFLKAHPETNSEDILKPIKEALDVVKSKTKEEPAAYKVGQMRERQDGRSKIYESFLGGNPNDNKNWKSLSTGVIDKPQQDGFGTYMSRPVSMFDSHTGRVVKVKAGEAAATPERYIDPRDPDVVALTQASRYEGSVSGFVKSIDELGPLVTNIMKTTGLNKNPKLANMPINELYKKRIIGDGDLAGLRNAMKGLRGELGKMAEGSMGVASVKAGTAADYEQNISDNMPLGEFIKMFNWAKQEGAARKRGLVGNINDIRSRLGAPPRKEASGGGPTKYVYQGGKLVAQ